MRSLLMLAGAALALAGCGASTRYPTEYEANFRSACANGGGTAAYCECVWGKIESEIPIEDFVAFDAAAQAGQSHPAGERIQGFTEQCLEQGT